MNFESKFIKNNVSFGKNISNIIKNALSSSKGNSNGKTQKTSSANNVNKINTNNVSNNNTLANKSVQLFNFDQREDDRVQLSLNEEDDEKDSKVTGKNKTEKASDNTETKKDTEKKDTNKDEKIDPTKQGKAGDCYLLSAINSLSYTEEGKKAIKDALEYKDDGSVVVHLKTGDIEVSKIDMLMAKGFLFWNNSYYSDGDDDMLAFEIAVKKTIDQINNGERDMPKELKEIPGDFSSFEGGTPSQIYYLLTGKAGDELKNENEINDALKYFEENKGKDFSLSLGSPVFNTHVKDTNGEEVEIYGGHAYAVKNVENGTVTVIDPQDSSKEIKLDKETFFKAFGFGSVFALDMSKVNSYDKWVEEKDKNRETINGVRYTYEYEYDDEGNVVSKSVHTDDGKAGLKYTYDENGKATVTLYDIDEKGNAKQDGEKLQVSEEDAKKIIDMGLLDLPKGYVTKAGLAHDIYSSKLWEIKGTKKEKIDNCFLKNLSMSSGRVKLNDIKNFSKLSEDNIDLAFRMLVSNPDLPANVVYLKLSGAWTEEQFQKYLKDHNIDYKLEDIKSVK